MVYVPSDVQFGIKGYDKQAVILNFTDSMYGTYFSYPVWWNLILRL